MPAVQETVDQVRRIDVDQYKYGFETLIESDKAPKGLNDDTIRFISAKKNEPQWMLDWRLDAYRRWQTMREPTWARVHYPPIDYQDLYYYSAPKKKDGPKSLDEIDPEILETYRKLGIPLREQEALLGVQRPANEDGDGEEGATNGNGTERRVAVDAVFDLGLGRDHVQGGARQGRRPVHADLGGAAEASGAGEAVSRHGGAGRPTTSSRR